MQIVADTLRTKDISDEEFALFKNLFFENAGIILAQGKFSFVQNRLQKRLNATRCNSYADYYHFITSGNHDDELEKAINLLTTNETYFFREPAHFEFLKNQVIPSLNFNSAVRVWSAASSTGEEAYSIAMTLSESKPHSDWEIVGTDLNTDVLKYAQRAVYPMVRIDGITESYLKKYFLRGKKDYKDHILVDQKLRFKTSFEQLNLMGERLTNDVGTFDVIFLRNVMIYFTIRERQQILNSVLECLKPGGWLFIGHSESLLGLSHQLTQKGPSIYQRKRNV
jgi:chemotaxis protein methyltransferase CheR